MKDSEEAAANREKKKKNYAVISQSSFFFSPSPVTWTREGGRQLSSDNINKGDAESERKRYRSSD